MESEVPNSYEKADSQWIDMITNHTQTLYLTMCPVFKMCKDKDEAEIDSGQSMADPNLDPTYCKKQSSIEDSLLLADRSLP